MKSETSGLAAIIKKGIEHLPTHLEKLASAQGLTQVLEQGEIQWRDDEGDLRALFFAIADPSELDSVARAYHRTRETGCPFTYVLVHQWSDGDGNWDIFTIRPTDHMAHRGRVWGSREVPDRKPHLRDDVYRLFESDSPFPSPGRDGWAKLLGTSRAEIAARLGDLAEERACVQYDDGGSILWRNKYGVVEALFALLPDPSDIYSFASIYDLIAAHQCPVTFVFIEREKSRLYDIFRLSGRSYLEHHNQAKSADYVEDDEVSDRP